MHIEVCVYSLASALIAQNAGPNSIELCAGQAEGGTTPSAGLIELVRSQVFLPIYMMTRPRGGDFLYSYTEYQVMCADVDIAKGLGLHGVVFGILRADGTVDEARTRQLVERAKPLHVTFHRAFDMTRDPAEALEAVISTGARRLLTSGGQQRAIDGTDLLSNLVKQAAGRIEIIAGSGVLERNVLELMATGVDGLHLSGSSRKDGGMQYRKEDISMTSTVPGEYERVETDEEIIRSVIDMMYESDSGMS